MKMKNSMRLFLVGGVLLTSMASANTVCSGVVINAGAGGVGMTTRNTTAVQVLPTEVDELTKANASENKFTGYVGLGYDFIVTPEAGDPNAPYLLRDIAVGINLYHMQTDRNGQVYPVSDPNNKNANYKEKFLSNRLMAETEWSFHPIWPLVIPFIQGGVGVAKNKMEYQQTAGEGNTAVSSFELQNNTRNQFAWDAGAGFKIPVNNHFQLTARYLYTGLGTIESSKHGKSDGVTLAKPIETDVHAQSVILGLSVIF